MDFELHDGKAQSPLTWGESDALYQAARFCLKHDCDTARLRLLMQSGGGRVALERTADERKFRSRAPFEADSEIVLRIMAAALDDYADTRLGRRDELLARQMAGELRVDGVACLINLIIPKEL